MGTSLQLIRLSPKVRLPIKAWERSGRSGDVQTFTCTCVTTPHRLTLLADHNENLKPDGGFHPSIRLEPKRFNSIPKESHPGFPYLFHDKHIAFNIYVDYDMHMQSFAY